MAGLPASGKSFIRQQNFDNLSHIDCDEIKKSLPEYDPKNPTATPAKSKILEKQAIYNNLANGISFVYDTTATNTDNVIKLTKTAQSLGYKVTLCFVKCSLATSLYRNANRVRVVPENIILEKFSVMKTSIATIRNFIDEYIEIENN